jgi:hypothetical protein
VLPLSGIQIDDTGRKVVFPNIKNKFRFVTVSLMLGSLVTVISSAAATPPDPDLEFTLSVTSCGDSAADWSPDFESYYLHGESPTLWTGTTPISAPQGSSVNFTVDLGWIDGSTDCGMMILNPTGSVTGIFDGLPPSFITQVLGASISAPFMSTITDYFTIPDDALITDNDLNLPVEGTYELTWTP